MLQFPLQLNERVTVIDPSVLKILGFLRVILERRQYPELMVILGECSENAKVIQKIPQPQTATLFQTRHLLADNPATPSSCLCDGSCLCWALPEPV